MTRTSCWMPDASTTPANGSPLAGHYVRETRRKAAVANLLTRLASPEARSCVGATGRRTAAFAWAATCRTLATPAGTRRPRFEATPDAEARVS
jgi:hypothetical protein